MTRGRYPDPPWGGTDEEWEAYMLARPFRLQHPHVFAARCIAAALIVAVVAALVQHLVTGH